MASVKIRIKRKKLNKKSDAKHLTKYSVADLRGFVRGDSFALKGYSRMNRQDIIDAIMCESINGRFTNILSEKTVAVPLFGSVKELREGKEAIKEVMKLPKNERRKALKGTLQKQLYKRELAKLKANAS